MQGTCGHIEINNNIATKIINRNSKSLKIEEQYNLQEIGYNLTKNFKTIKIPKPFNLQKKSYDMEKIDDSYPYYSNESKDNTNFIQELIKLYDEFIKIEYFPNDYECYLQNDRSICIIDFDKFIKIADKQKLDHLLIGAFIPKNFQNVFRL
jgi:RIO-like serine/threonine protein kinase